MKNEEPQAALFSFCEKCKVFNEKTKVKKLMKTILEKIQPLEKDFQSIVLNLFRQLRKIIGKEKKEARMMYHKRDNTNKETGITKRNQIKIWRLKKIQ